MLGKFLQKFVPNRFIKNASLYRSTLGRRAYSNGIVKGVINSVFDGESVKQNKVQESEDREVICQLTEYYKNNDYDKIGSLPKFKIAEVRDYNLDKSNKRDCIWYVAQQKNVEITGDFSFSSWQPHNYCQVKLPQQEDLVVYHANLTGTSENHIGICEENEWVKSKFGYGHVYKHPVNYIPKHYGPYKSYFTLSKNLELGNFATIENMEEWIKLYGTIGSIKVNFPNGFPEGRRKKIIHFLEKHPSFIEYGYQGSFNLETHASSSAHKYKVIHNFLEDKQNREALKNFYFGTSRVFDKTNSGPCGTPHAGIRV